MSISPVSMGRPDHPRACGANVSGLMETWCRVGSSPRVRGKQIYKLGVFTCSRIIPARAGQTSSRDPPPGFRPEHPRACGANGVAPNTDHMPIGSSPRVRGKHRASGETAAQVRIIPARAGQTTRPTQARQPAPDHPRACGANSFFLSSHVLGFGSSPRVRGKRVVRVPGRLPARIIPARAGQTARRCRAAPERPDHPRACGANAAIGGVSSLRIIPARAGQTHSRQPSSRRLSDHPRACGANSLSKTCMFPLSGSSPRVRGKLAYARRRRRPVRIIPARAGQTRPPHTDWLSRPDHPRACGANYLTALIVFIAIGSSPRVRGKPRGLAAGQRGGRIIPARAGQTVWGGQRGASRADHPRACGATSASAVTVTLPGSSPRVRGKQRASRQPDEHVRIIPARAGQTRSAS